MRTARSGKIVVEHRPKSTLPLRAAGKRPSDCTTTNSIFSGFEQIFGDLVGHIDLETDELAIVVDIGEGRRRAVSGHDQLVALQYRVEQRFLPRGRTGEPKTSQ